MIILFERPLRVGDIVTVDDVTGVVSRVRIRATTITNWDRKEFVVPNKEFITGKLLNWTLSDQVNRIVINIGIAYGSDTEKARNLLLKIAREHPLLLADPEPVAILRGFRRQRAESRPAGLSAHVREPAERDSRTAHGDPPGIRRRRAGDPLPQRDLHVRSIGPDCRLCLASRRAAGRKP